MTISIAAVLLSAGATVAAAYSLILVRTEGRRLLQLYIAACHQIERLEIVNASLRADLEACQQERDRLSDRPTP